jgi:hypothetical protein
MKQSKARLIRFVRTGVSPVPQMANSVEGVDVYEAQHA